MTEVTEKVMQEDLLPFMAKVWKNGTAGEEPSPSFLRPHSLTTLTVRLKQQYEWNDLESERVLVVGNTRPNKIWEEAPAVLVALTQSLIICSFFGERESVLCTGVLKRGRGITKYEINSFSHLNNEPDQGYTRLRAGPGVINHPTAAAVFEWSYGRDEFGWVEISREHWAVMEPWIEKWLAHST